MADVSAIYTLTTPGGTITFNNGTLHSDDDLYWIQEIEGLDGVEIRAPVDPRPLTHGGIVHPFWKGPRHITLDGVILIQSVPLGADCREPRNDLSEALRLALDSIIAADGTLAYTPEGLSPVSLTVRNEIPLVYRHIENYAVLGFTFGLISEDSDL